MGELSQVSGQRRFRPIDRAALQRASQYSREHRDEEKEKGDAHWKIIDSDLRDYETFFIPVFDYPDGIMPFMRERRRQHKPLVVLDLMSNGHPYVDMRTDATLAVCLHENRTEQRQVFERDRAHLTVLPGDAYEGSTWREIDIWLRKTAPNTHAFDLVTVRPVGPIKAVPEDPRLLYIMMQRLWQRLNPDGGMLLTQIPEHARKITERWSEKLRSSGITAVHPLAHKEYSTLMMLKLIRKNNDPHRLPEL